MTAVLVRPATVEDAATILTVHVDSIRDLCSAAYDAQTIGVWLSGKHADNYLDPIAQRPFFVAIVEGRVGGFSELAPREAEVRAVYVSPRFIRSGVGTRLLTAVEDTARSLRLPRLWLDASLNSIEFYARRGFTAEAEGVVMLAPNVTLRCMRMSKALPTNT